MMIGIRDALTAGEVGEAGRLMREYADGLGVDLCFQGFDAELAGLPGDYVRPAGRLMVAWRGMEAVGCVAIRPLSAGDCEMKRLYVRPDARVCGTGRLLVEAACDAARHAGYARICLDTLPTMHAAQALYRSLGFHEIDAYTHNPIPGAKYLALGLRPGV